MNAKRNYLKKKRSEDDGSFSAQKETYDELIKSSKDQGSQTTLLLWEQAKCSKIQYLGFYESWYKK